MPGPTADVLQIPQCPRGPACWADGVKLLLDRGQRIDGRDERDERDEVGDRLLAGLIGLATILGPFSLFG